MSKNQERKQRRYQNPDHEGRQGIGGMGERAIYDELHEGSGRVELMGKTITAWDMKRK